MVFPSDTDKQQLDNEYDIIEKRKVNLEKNYEFQKIIFNLIIALFIVAFSFIN